MSTRVFPSLRWTAGPTRLPTATPTNRTGAPHRSFLTVAKAMLDRAVEFKEVLLAHGLGATLIDELTKALAEFDTTTGSVHAGRVSHVGARAELKEGVADCVQLVGRRGKAPGRWWGRGVP